MVFDFISLTYLLATDKREAICGGRHDLYRQQFEDFLIRLSVFAKLVFFSDGSVVEAKIDKWFSRQDERHRDSIIVTEDVKKSIPLSQIIEKRKNIPKATFDLPMFEIIARKYGQLFVTLSAECDAELVQYANKNRSVLAIFSNDSDFLIFEGNWRYFATNQLDIKTLTTAEFNRKALRKQLDLDDNQMKILATLCGNDVIKYEDVKRFHEENCGHNIEPKFNWIAKHVKENLNQEENFVIDIITSKIYKNKSPEMRKIIKKSLMQYDTVSFFWIENNKCELKSKKLYFRVFNLILFLMIHF